ncbi:hypothetical protein L6R53_05015 [Myxococcota bacterium]|nr:hypothetical protein [Myxococcota bacterium]
MSAILSVLVLVVSCTPSSPDGGGSAWPSDGSTVAISLPLDSGDPTDGGSGGDSGAGGGVGSDSGSDGGSGSDSGASGVVAPGLVSVTAGAADLVADGRSAQLVTIRAWDAEGAPVPAGTDLGLHSTLGSFGEVTWLGDGMAKVTWTSGTWPGIARLSAGEGWSSEGDLRIRLVEGKGQAAQLHLHGSLSEGTATMRGHTRAAEEAGLDLLWWTDHDYLYHADDYWRHTGNTFEADSTSGYGEYAKGWAPGDNTLESSTFARTSVAALDGELGLKIHVNASTDSTEAEPEQASWEWMERGRNNFVSLLSEVTFQMSIRPTATDDNAELFIVIPLSRRADSEEETPYRSIVLVSSTRTYTSDDWTLYVPMDLAAAEWNVVEADLTALALEHWGEFGMDHHAELFSVAVRAWGGALAVWHVDNVVVTQDRLGEDLRRAQRDYLDGLESTIVHHIGTELSHATDSHANAFYPGDRWTFMPYEAPNSILLHDAVQAVHDEGGIVSYNHIFGTLSKTEGPTVVAGMVEDAIQDLAENEGFGCDLLEVGYRSRGGDLAAFLQVWDRLALDHGLFMTGIGTSDQHHTNPGIAHNNFVTWVGSASTEADDMIADLKRGMAWFGDPDRFTDADTRVTLKALDSQAVMGQIVVGAVDAQRVVFSAGPLRRGWEVKAIVDGRVVDTWDVTMLGTFRGEITVDPTVTTLVRFEVHHPFSGGILFTNPIYFVPEGTEVPAERVPTP